MFKHTTIEAYARQATQYLAARLAEETLEKPVYLGYQMQAFGETMARASKEAIDYRAVLDERTETKTEQVMSDIWENVTRRYSLIFGSYETMYGRQYGLAWVCDSYVPGFGNDGVRYYFHAVDREVPNSLAEAMFEWVQNEAGKLEGETAATKAVEKFERERREIKTGVVVKVVKGRKVKVGTVGTVFWSGKNSFGYSVGITVSGVKEGGKFADAQFTSLNNVEIVLDEEALAAEMKALYNNTFAKVRSEVAAKWRNTLIELGIGSAEAARKLAA